MMNERVLLQRKPASNPATTMQDWNRASAQAIEHARASSAQTLDVTTRARMETRLGHHFAGIPVTPISRTAGETRVVAADDQTEREADWASESVPQFGGGESLTPRVNFGGVRIHTDGSAQRAARALNALAFTMGRDIFFDDGQYAPETAGGERLIAHELTHVLQQTQTSNPSILIQRKEASKGLPPADALQVALKGDDDATRDLTHNAGWNDIQIDPKQSATLIIHLLDGYTGDDDEQAGLEILRKDIGEGILDPTLWELNTRGRFGQLLDDYDGSEYRDLLVLLSNNILNQRVRARYLDEFITMWWVREHEERAIVQLLINTSDSDRAELLAPKFREEGLRDAIDTDELSVKYETLVQEAMGERAEKMSKDKQRWTKLFDEETKKCIRKGLGKAKDDEMLQRALADVEKEVAHDVLNYSEDVLHETIRPFGNPDPGRLAEINREFRKKMDGLLEHKRAEFCHELKWGIEFNRNLDQVWGINWTDQDLNKMDEILGAIPAEIRNADPRFTAFLRERERPSKKWLWGQTNASRGEISLLHGLQLGVVAHELGHIIHELDPQLLNDFENLSGWETLDDAKLDALKKGDKKNDKDFQPLLARLEEKRKKDDPDDVGENYKDGFFYLYNRYGGGYFRYPTRRPEGASFVSSYAGTHPEDDFAETFSDYLANPKKLQEKQYRKKYLFIHTEVFVRFWLHRQFRAANDEIDKIIAATMSKYPEHNPMVERVREGPIQQLWDKFFEAENNMVKARTAEAETTKLMQTKPLEGSTQAQDVTRAFVQEAQDLMALAEKIIKPHNQMFGIMAAGFNDLDKSLEDAFNSLSDEFMNQFTLDLIDQFEPLADRILKGEHIVKNPWTEVDAIVARMDNVPKVIEGYLPIYREIIETRKELFTFVRQELDKFKQNEASRESLRVFAVERIKMFNADAERVKSNIRAGTPFDKSAFGNPGARGTQDKKDITAFEKTLKP